MTITDLFKVNSRLGRIRYMGLLSFNAALIIIIYAAILFIQKNLRITSVGSGYAPIPFLAAIYFITITFSNIRRIHDLNYSGWCAIPLLLPSINILISSLGWQPPFMHLAITNVLYTLISWVFPIISILPGTVGDNRFGKQPENPTMKDCYLIMSAPISLLLFCCAGVFGIIF